MELERLRRLAPDHGFFALVAGSLLWCVLYAARIHYSGRLLYGFLIWNLFLAWVPWLLAIAVARSVERGHRSVAVLTTGAWLVFLPNAPYVITDFLHLRARSPVPLWFDVLLLGTASLTGLLAGAFSLRRVEHALSGRLDARLLHGGLWLAIALSGFGIYLGRFERWNSWDLLLHPSAVLASVTQLLHLRALVVTFACAGLLGVTYLGVRDAQRKEGA
jgi:uncharacterized membrane protein